MEIITIPLRGIRISLHNGFSCCDFFGDYCGLREAYFITISSKDRDMLYLLIIAVVMKGLMIMRAVRPICQGCGQPISANVNYIQALGANWHPEHFVCAACGQPLSGSGFSIYQGEPYHIACYSQYRAPRCVYCGKPLVGEYLIDHWGQTFCKEHQGHYPMCRFCGRLVPPDQRENDAEVVRCVVCRVAAIETSQDARPLFSQVIHWISNQGLKYNNFHLNLDLCGREHLQRLLQHVSHGDSLGVTTSATYVQNGQTVRTEVNGIAVLRGMPTTLFRGVVAHELGHVWLIIHGVHLPTWSEEGFCELLSYRYYQELQTPESLYHATAIENNSDPVYGDGFRRVRLLADSQGFLHFLESLRTLKRLPM
jgi:hypothetical protein